MLKPLSLLFFIFILILNLQLVSTVFAQGTVSCLGVVNSSLCTNSSTNTCASGYEPPSCQDYANQVGFCPLSLDCVFPNTTPSPGPSVPPGSKCGSQGQTCCGTIPPLYCNSGFNPDNAGVPDSCKCKAIPTPTPTAKVSAGATSIPTPPGGAGVTCHSDLYATGIQTAIGCVPTDPTKFITAVGQLATGAGGGIALLLMIAGVFRMMTSAGNPDAVKAGSEQFTSALIGLLFIVFAVLLLKVIGVNILNIPGFGPI